MALATTGATAATAVILMLVVQPFAANETRAEHAAPAAIGPVASTAAASEGYRAPSAAQIAALPEAAATMEYTISDLIPFSDGPIVDRTYRLDADAPLYGAARDTGPPVARLNSQSFLGDPTPVVVSHFDGEWALVLTPARMALPSDSASGTAPAQTAGWTRRDLLTVSHAQTHRIIVDIDRRTATIQTWSGDIVDTFRVGVGGSDTPSPTATTYIQARYLDPAQGQTKHRIQLTAAYSSQNDAPWSGSAHMGFHFSDEPQADSHGCVRMTADGIEAVDALPLGTVIQFRSGGR